MPCLPGFQPEGRAFVFAVLNSDSHDIGSIRTVLAWFSDYVTLSFESS